VFPHSPWSQRGPSEIARFERSERGKRRKRKMIMMIFHTFKIVVLAPKSSTLQFPSGQATRRPERSEMCEDMRSDVHVKGMRST
jgi:hypothetical protein